MEITGFTFEEATPESLGLTQESVNSFSNPVKTKLKDKDNEQTESLDKN